MHIPNTHSAFQNLEVNLDRLIDNDHMFSFKSRNSADSNYIPCLHALTDQILRRLGATVDQWVKHWPTEPEGK